MRGPQRSDPFVDLAELQKHAPSQTCALASSGLSSIARRRCCIAFCAGRGMPRNLTLQIVRAAERGPRRRVVGSSCDGPLEERDRTVHRLAAGGAHVQHATRVGLERLDRSRLVALDGIGVCLPELQLETADSRRRRCGPGARRSRRPGRRPSPCEISLPVSTSTSCTVTRIRSPRR